VKRPPLFFEKGKTMKKTYQQDIKAQQVPIPTPAAEGSGPASGKRDDRGVHPAIGRMAYIGGWTVVSMQNDWKTVD
jgi:hypothetical protein